MPAKVTTQLVIEGKNNTNQAFDQLNSGVDGEADYSTAQSLKVSAKDALRSGDLEGAKSQAQAALKVLLDLHERAP